MKIRCPACRKEAEWSHNPFRPFCSERCKLIDLGAWASEHYVIEGKLQDEMESLPSEEEKQDA
jgi:endogenous inhibitor of DNA gyrase (YacG/DUF329 family)